MKAVCMVAHPDDCVIFGWSLMHNFPQLDWHVTYLTYQDTDSRAKEFREFWLRRHITTEFLGFPDDYHDIENNCPSFDTDSARDAIRQCLQHADVILSHDSVGDYGHPHHRFVHDCVAQLCHDHVMTFAPPGRGTHDYSIEQPQYTESELPLHWHIIKAFHPDSHRNSYTMSAATHHRITNA
jgi:LmbE family N-acetylglucosaminyl deacetylase